MNTDERGLKTIGLSVFISVDRRLNVFFFGLLQQPLIA
jgi:hypothetical protein